MVSIIFLNFLINIFLCLCHQSMKKSGRTSAYMQVYSKLLAARKISLYRFKKLVCNDINTAEPKFPQCAYVENNIPSVSQTRPNSSYHFGQKRPFRSKKCPFRPTKKMYYGQPKYRLTHNWVNKIKIKKNSIFCIRNI
jgi:hypothetical protein